MKTIFQRITEVAEGKDVESVTTRDFFKIFKPEIKRIRDICVEAEILNRQSESVSFKVQLDKGDDIDRCLHELLSVAASRRMIETKLYGREFKRHNSLVDRFTFSDPHLQALENFEVEVTLYRAILKRRNP